MTSPTPDKPGRPARLPPRWVIRSFWVVHRALFVLTRGRFGLRRQSPKQWGMMRLTTIGRRFRQRAARHRGLLRGRSEPGHHGHERLGRAEPAWWLNLQANPDTTVELADGPRLVRGRAATPEEKPRLWARWAEYDGEEALESWAARRPGETAVVILEPRAATEP